MKSPIFRIATGPGIIKPGLAIADSIELFANVSKIQTTRAGGKVDHTYVPVEVNALFDVRCKKCDLGYAY